MRISFTKIHRCGLSPRLGNGLLALSLLFGITNTTRADFLSVGDVSSTNGTGNSAVNEAGGVADDLIIGDTGVGGLLGDGVAPLFGTLSALESSSVIIGNQDGSIGAANIEDFIPGGNWQISGDLVVGNAGQGFLDFLNAAGVQDAPSSVILGTTYVGGGSGTTLSSAAGLMGDPRLGQGVVRINGLGSNFTTRALVVGGAGVGLIEATGRAQIYSQEAVDIGSSVSVVNSFGQFGDGTIHLTDLGTRWSARGPVTVGGLTGLSHGKIVVANQAVFQVDGISLPVPPSILPGSLTINPRGTVELSGGTIRMLPQAVGNLIINNGVIEGSGFIDGGMTIGTPNDDNGELRNAAGLANERERLIVTESVLNDGRIQSLGGAMDFEAAVTNNTGDIIARDAEMHFRAGVTNNTGGSITLGGDTTVHGTIAMNGGTLNVLSDSESLMVGDLTFTASSVLGLTAGPAAGTLDVIGQINLGTDTTLDLDYSAGVLAQPGDTYEILSSSEPIVGTFINAGNQVSDDEGNLWDIIYGTNSVLVTATGTTVVPIMGDFNRDGDVNGGDFLDWQRGLSPTPLSPADLADWETNYGSVSPVMALTGAAAAVPEPTTLALVLCSLACCPRRRRQN